MHILQKDKIQWIVPMSKLMTSIMRIFQLGFSSEVAWRRLIGIVSKSRDYMVWNMRTRCKLQTVFAAQI